MIRKGSPQVPGHAMSLQAGLFHGMQRRTIDVIWALLSAAGDPSILCVSLRNGCNSSLPRSWNASSGRRLCNAKERAE
jgi:hypothetical protein